MKLLIILIILIFILLCVYNTNIDTFSSGGTTSTGVTTPTGVTTSTGVTTTSGETILDIWKYDDKIKLDMPKIEKNNIKLSWLKPFSLDVIEYYIVLEKIYKDNTINKQIFTYKNKNTVINYYIGNLDNGTYKIYLFYKNKKETKYTLYKTNTVDVVIDYNNTILYNENTNTNTNIYTVDTQYSIIKDTLSEFNTINDNYYINIY